MSHKNDGSCSRCIELFNHYDDFNQSLKNWFIELQRSYPEAHISCAGRGKADQEAAFSKGISRARFGESAHNYGMAIDIFVQLHGEKTIYPLDWFENVLQPNLEPWLEWYGAKGAVYYELPHIEIRGWKQIVEVGEVNLVEPK